MDIFNTILHYSHNILRWAVLLTGVWAMYLAFNGVNSKRTWESKDNKAGMLFVLFCHLQLLLGFILYFYLGKYTLFSDMATNMKDPEIRYWGMEHLLGNIIAIALIQYGRIASKKAVTDLAKHKKALIWFTVGLLILLVNIPWPWTKISAAIFPGM